jgi:RHS repeat-associated protein
MPIESLSYTSTEPQNLNLYNGKEQQPSYNLDWLEYGARMYDAQIARFPSLDPKADEFAFVSPYNYAENRPVDCIDLWGLQRLQVLSEQQKKYAESKYSNFQNYINPKPIYVKTLDNGTIRQAPSAYENYLSTIDPEMVKHYISNPIFASVGAGAILTPIVESSMAVVPYALKISKIWYLNFTINTAAELN